MSLHSFASPDVKNMIDSDTLHFLPMPVIALGMALPVGRLKYLDNCYK